MLCKLPAAPPKVLGRGCPRPGVRAHILASVTFSIVGRAEGGDQVGVAVASKFLAAGALVPAVEVGTGALATQAYSNLSYRNDGLELLRSGRSADEVVALLTSADEGRELRQLGVVGRTGEGATFTGTECMPWAGGRAGDGYAVQGNILAGEAVVADMERAWLARSALPLAWRLLETLEAGDTAGGDRRGRQSAGLIVAVRGAGYGGSNIAVDLRVDDHPAPVGELRRLLGLHDFYFAKPDPASLVSLEGELLDEVSARLASLGFRPEGAGTKGVEDALTSWASMENLEMRYTGGPSIDPLVLGFLREKSADREHR